MNILSPLLASLSLSLSPYSISQFCNFVFKVWKNIFFKSPFSRDEQGIEVGDIL
jgi:hypothetical protein